ncbi:MAG: CDP-diacylglycerol--glycerol-3-phosphate 3-phosphatidyltransferase [Planctomycetota bacterium]
MLEQILNWANLITISRVLLIPGFMIAFLNGGKIGYTVALSFALFFEVSDWFDGFVARATGKVTDLGKLLDPLADTLSRFMIFLTFLAAGVAPLWMVALLFLRDMVVAYVRVGAAMQKVVMSARNTGKIKAAFQGTGIVLIIASLIAHEYGWLPIDVHELSWWIMLCVTTYTVYSMCDYVWGLYRLAVAQKG